MACVQLQLDELKRDWIKEAVRTFFEMYCSGERFAAENVQQTD